MRDRVSTKILDNGATRYGVYDEDGNLLRYEYIKLEDEPDEEGTILNKANLLTDETAALLGLDQENPTVNEAFEALAPAQYNGKSALRISIITESTNFVAPDAIVGKIHVMLFGGGGGSGGNSTSSYCGGGGGGGGHMVEADIAVTPGQTYPIVIGAGGSAGTSAATGTSGGKGGSTTAFGLVAEGGTGGGGATSSAAGKGGDGGTGGGGGYLSVSESLNGKAAGAGGKGSYGGGGAGGTLGGGGKYVYTKGGNGGNGGTYGGGGAGGDATKGSGTSSSLVVSGGTGGAGGTYGGRGADGKGFASGSYTATVSVLSSGGTSVDGVSTFFSPYFLLLKDLFYASGETRSGSVYGGGGYGDQLNPGTGKGGGGYGASAKGSGGAGYGSPGVGTEECGGGGGGFFDFGASGGKQGAAGTSGVACLIYYVSLEEETL